MMSTTGIVERALLAGWLQRIVGPGADACSKILDVIYIVIGQIGLAQSPEIQPFERSPFQSAVIQVEPVDVNTGSGLLCGHFMFQKCRSPLAGASRLKAEAFRGGGMLAS